MKYLKHSFNSNYNCIYCSRYYTYIIINLSYEELKLGKNVETFQDIFSYLSMMKILI